MSFKSKGGDFVSYKNVVGGKKQLLRRKTGQLKLSSSFVDDGWQDWRLSKKEFSGIASRFGKKQRKGRSLVIANELAGQYEDSFEDVKGVRKFIEFDI
ncbi:hypothetical protein GIB67_018177 [Kingdonia uniflora]|uniref:Uncharacterized protein n=1 Tax=Kingdonia uniflora TaxID=39325 RepID=A0A7J7NMA7_9MAGN|nr:hypothetical protein GIB67_018177 [Kingdonia uniflora]